MTEDEYVEIGITILESAPHRARVKVSMTITRLIDEILKEFDDMDRSDPGRYALFLGGGDKPLPHQATLAKLDICNQDELAFRYLQVSRRRNLPVDKILSLQDDQGQTYDINWQPAVIGRPTIDPDHNQMLAVNLQSHPNGNHISRQHAQITFNKDHFYIEPLNENNPVTLNNELSPIQTPRELAVGDRIVLGKGRVVLKVLTPVSRKQQVDDSSGTQVSAMAAGGSTYLSGPPPRARGSPSFQVMHRRCLLRLPAFPTSSAVKWLNPAWKTRLSRANTPKSTLIRPLASLP